MTDRSAGTLFSGTGELARLLRERDWTATGLGPVEEWPDQLRAAVRTVLPSAMPMMLFWGPGLIQIYNEAYVPLLGSKHPAALGQSPALTWPEVWHASGPESTLEIVLAGGEVLSREAQLYLLQRHGYVEETYWTSSCSPIRDEDGTIGGALLTAADVTRQVVGERRSRLIRELGGLSAAAAADRAGACRQALTVMHDYRATVPFAVIYLPDPDELDPDDRAPEDPAATTTAAATHRAATTTGVSPVGAFGISGDLTKVGGPDVSESILRALRAEGRPELVTGLSAKVPVGTLEPSPLGAAVPHSMMVLPLRFGGQSEPMGALCLGVNPYRMFDEEYRGFFTLLGHQVATLLADAQAYEAQRARADALTELDREKTRFYQNVSHEFRTPLTLLLGPLEAATKAPAVRADSELLNGLEMAHRSALRLTRLVDGLLDFARADAGSLNPRLEPTDVAELTRDLTGMFKSAFQEAGLDLRVDIPNRASTARLDREMWAQIVLNLLSNALKYTPQGTVSIQLRQTEKEIELRVADTGVGIPAAEQQAIFDRFHRINSEELKPQVPGAGIGLALVAQLVRAHTGEISVDSKPRRGSTFTVSIPHQAAGDAELRPLAVSAGTSDPLVAAGRGVWSPGHHETVSEQSSGPTRNLLLVEDDPDLRLYLTRLLSADGWRVDSASDLAGALSTQTVPDVVLSDVMLPGPDGLELVRLLRRGEDGLSRVPIILLTARAAAESAAEGLRAGADDYVRKPFNPTELLARLRVHYELSQLREYALAQAQDQAANLRKALASNRQIGAAMGILMARHHITADQAFAELRSASQQNHQKLRDVAEEVLFTGELPTPSARRAADS